MTSTPLDLTTLWRETEQVFAGVFETMEWCEDEIEQATRRHPDQADTLYHAFLLLKPTASMPPVEFVYRGHARELLERIAAGQDTRPGTAAEVCLVCSESSLQAPLTTAAAGLYFRMWKQAFPDAPQPGGDALDHYEGLRNPDIDYLEQLTRRRAAIPERRIGKVDCPGTHHGIEVVCRYAKPDDA
jgi:hypothetical protein